MITFILIMTIVVLLVYLYISNLDKTKAGAQIDAGNDDFKDDYTKDRKISSEIAKDMKETAETSNWGVERSHKPNPNNPKVTTWAKDPQFFWDPEQGKFHIWLNFYEDQNNDIDGMAGIKIPSKIAGIKIHPTRKVEYRRQAKEVTVYIWQEDLATIKKGGSRQYAKGISPSGLEFNDRSKDVAGVGASTSNSDCSHGNKNVPDRVHYGPWGLEWLPNEKRWNFFSRVWELEPLDGNWLEIADSMPIPKHIYGIPVDCDKDGSEEKGASEIWRYVKSKKYNSLYEYDEGFKLLGEEYKNRNVILAGLLLVYLLRQ